MREIRTASFAGHEFKYWSYDVLDIVRVRGWDSMAESARDAAGAAAATSGTFSDEAEVRERHWRFDPGDEVVDVGPAFGSYALTAAVQGAQVTALEPCQFCAEILDANAGINPGIARRITLVETGLHEEDGWYDPDADAWHSEKTTPSFLRVSTMDSMLGGMDRIDMVKLDVEGAEAGVLRGGEKILRRFGPKLLIEEHEFRRPGIGAECEKILASYGYGPPSSRVKHHGVMHAFYEKIGVRNG